MSNISSMELSAIGVNNKPDALNVTFCDHSTIFVRPDLLRCSTPPPSLSPKNIKIKQFSYSPRFSNDTSIDDTVLPFIKQYRKKKQEEKDKINYNEKLKEGKVKYKENKAIPISGQKRFAKICKTKIMSQLNRKRHSINVPPLALDKINKFDNRFAIGWNFLNSITKETLLSDDLNSSENLNKLKSFMSYTSMIFSFNHHMARWKTSDDIRNLSAMTTSRYRKE